MEVIDSNFRVNFRKLQVLLPKNIKSSPKPSVSSSQKFWVFPHINLKAKIFLKKQVLGQLQDFNFDSCKSTTFSFLMSRRC